MRPREEINRLQRERRKANDNLYTQRYEKTKRGFLMRKYRNMQSRVTGVQKQKHHLYHGKSLLDREEFYQWAMGHPIFHRLFTVWRESGYERKLCPTVDRIDPERGYELDNMQWITHSENSSRGALSRFGKLKDFERAGEHG